VRLFKALILTIAYVFFVYLLLACSKALDTEPGLRVGTRNRKWETVPKFDHFQAIKPLLEFAFCAPAPAMSAPVERIFSQGGLLIRPHRTRLSDKMLCQLMIAKCNKD